MDIKFLNRKNDLAVSRLTEATTLATTDLLYAETTGTGDIRRKITFSNMVTALFGSLSTLIVPTGVMVPWLGLSAPTSWIFASGKTIGNATSNATARANADTASLYSVLWQAFGNTELVIYTSAGAPTTRGVSAAADFSANKALALPDLRGRSVFGLDNLGGTAANRITNAVAGIVGTTQGATGGAQSVELTAGQLPAHTHDVTAVAAPTAASASTGTDVAIPPAASTITSTSVGDGDAVIILPPLILVPWIIKL